MPVTSKAQQNALRWLDANMANNYPISDDCTCVSTNGNYLPSSFLVDLILMIPVMPEADAAGRFYVSSVVRNGDQIKLELSYKPDGGDPFICAISGAINASAVMTDDIQSRTYPLIPASTIPDSHAELSSLYGSFIVGTCADIDSNAAYSMTPEAATIQSTRVVQTISGFRGVTVVAADGTAVNFDENFVFEAGDGIDFQFNQLADPPSVTILRVPTEDETEAEYTSVEDVIAAVYAAIGEPVKTINDVYPDADGNITIKGLDCTTIGASIGGITISNTCSKPCCTDESTADMSAAIQSLEDAKNRLTAYFENMATNINAMQSRLASLIASRE